MKKRMLFVALCTVVLLVASFVGCGNTNLTASSTDESTQVSSNSEPASTTTTSGENPIVTITMESGEIIKLELYPDMAPNTVNNFIDLVSSGYYDGLGFHRIVPGFMIQGGDPEGSGMGGPDYTIAGEFASNGFTQNTLSHTEGVISMARSSDPDSAGSQFFICDGDASFLDGQYAAFGKVIEGQDVVNKIANEPAQNEMAVTPAIMKTVTVDTFGVPYPDPTIISEGSFEMTFDPIQNSKPGENPIVTITMETGDIIKLELFPEVAPNTVNNFISLVSSGYYDGLVFHRIVPGFMIQGGDPTGTGTGGPGYAIAGEFAMNGFTQNTLSHKEGVLSMARSGMPDSAGSQFFICDGDASFLDGQYAAFGIVIEGQDVVNKIANEPAQNEMAVTPAVMKTVTVDTFGVEYPAPVTVAG